MMATFQGPKADVDRKERELKMAGFLPHTGEGPIKPKTYLRKDFHGDERTFIGEPMGRLDWLDAL